MSLRGLGELSRAYLLQSLRSRTALLWNLVFPQLWLFAFGFLFGGGTAAGVNDRMPGVFALTTMAGAFFGVSYLMVSEREQEVLRRYRVTPVSALTIILANGARSIVMVTASLLVQGIIAWLVFDITIASSLAALATALLLGAVAFVPLGLMLGSVARDMRSAPALANLVFFPMMFLSGAAVPFEMLPGWLQQLARLLPATYLTEALDGVMVRGETLAELSAPLLVLVLTAVVAATLNALLFRWESSEPLEPRRVGAALAGLTVLYLAAALVAPELRMSSDASARPAAMSGASPSPKVRRAQHDDPATGRTRRGRWRDDSGVLR